MPGADSRDASVCRSETPKPSQRFPRSRRVRARRQFLEIYRHGRKVSCGPALTLFGLANEVGRCRLGVTVTRKVGGAVTRNRVKRVLREIFRRSTDCRNQSMDLVINANPSFTTRTREEIENEFGRALERLLRSARR